MTTVPAFAAKTLDLPIPKLKWTPKNGQLGRLVFVMILPR